MNSRQLQYAVLLSEAGNFSHVAEKLNITQPALSKQILSLEKELGTQLFDRNRNPVSLTAAGEHFIREAKELLYRESQLIKSMEQFSSGDKGQLVIGITPFRSAYLIPETVKKIREKFPGVQVKLAEEGSEALRKDAAEGMFDFAVVNMPVDESVLDAVLIEPDRLALVIPEAMDSAFKGKDEVDFSVCRDIPFVVLGAGQEMRQLFEKLCADSGIRPETAAEVVNLTSAWEMACAGVGATLLPVQFVNGKRDSHVTVVKLKNSFYLRQPAVVIKKGQYISEYARYAINLLTKNED
ncbi:MAG: LysR family transcriptional regulator [Clostridia bacterium]|nr:LysR family transcriptional regulator [Clostridia bacterium]